MVSILKLELVKILLNNKRDTINRSIIQLEKIISFFNEFENADDLLEYVLDEKELEAISTIFWLSFTPIQDRISLELSRKFHQMSDEYTGQEINEFIWNIDDLIIDLKFDEIYRINEALNKVQNNINRLDDK